ncbi:MAG: DNA polymerase III subunit delta' [Bacteroidetes bacterium ADurb.Bin028]|nr:MAG: DNA polymerase III subunit delta' [Bacteroidetes bacterium ADurb.Bin028]
MKFEEILGQSEIKEKLIQSYMNNRVSHSYLFFGTAGSGKLGLAIAFAQYLSCTNKQENDSCGQCPSCKKYEKLIHPDLHFVFPVITEAGKKKISDAFISEWREMILSDVYVSYNEWMQNLGSQNKQGLISVDESAEIIRKLSLKSFESEYKIMIIWLPEKMHVSCANKLLKMLEEPPHNTIFILVSDERESVLPTILSRTQAVKILGIDDDIMEKHIIDKYNLSAQEAKDIVRISNGSYVEAKQQILANEENKFNLKQFIHFMRLTYSRNIAEALTWAEDMAKIGREPQKSFLKYSSILIRENFVYNFNDNNIYYLTKEEEEFARNFARFLNSENVNSIAKIFDDAHYGIERNGAAKIIFTDIAFLVMRVIRK